MLAKNHPEMEEPIYYAKKMSLYQKWRDYMLHKNLAKVDERMLHLHWKKVAMAEGLAKGRAEVIELIRKGVPLEEIEKMIAL